MSLLIKYCLKGSGSSSNLKKTPRTVRHDKSNRLFWEEVTEECSRAGSLSLTPVMTAPLEQLRDTRRKDSSTTLKPMTATGHLWEKKKPTLNGGQQLFTGLSCTSRWILALQSLKDNQNSSEGFSHTLSLSLSTSDPHPALPPSCLFSLHQDVPTPSLSPQRLSSCFNHRRGRLIDTYTGPLDTCAS